MKNNKTSPVSSQNTPVGRDLHVNKASHIALPIDTKTEFHLKQADVSVSAKPNETYTISMPVICTSSDEEGARFRQISKAYVEDKSVFANNYRTASDDEPTNKPKASSTLKNGVTVDRYSKGR